MSPILGGYCGGVPPLPIPNRAVKPAIADGTAMQCGRVGSRLFLMSVLRFGQPIRRTLFLFGAEVLFTYVKIIVYLRQKCLI